MCAADTSVAGRSLRFRDLTVDKSRFSVIVRNILPWNSGCCFSFSQELLPCGCSITSTLRKMELVVETALRELSGKKLLKFDMVMAVKRCFLRRDCLQRDFISKILPVDDYVNLKTALHLYSFLTKFCT